MTGPGYDEALSAGRWRQKDKVSAWPDNAEKPVALSYGVPSSVIGGRSVMGACDARPLITAFEGEPTSWRAWESKYSQAEQWATTALRTFGGDLNSLCCAVKNLLIDMAYQLGFDGLVKFKKLIFGLLAEDWEQASYQATQTLWFARAGRRAELHASTLQSGCAARRAWKKAPSGSDKFVKGGPQKKADETAGSYASFEPTNGATQPNVKLPTVRATAVGGMNAYREALSRAGDRMAAGRTLAVRLDLPPSSESHGTDYTAAYSLVRANSWCKYSAQVEYLGSFDMVGAQYSSQGTLSGLQACANQCARTRGCTVFAWKNYKQQYNDPELANYDNRPCHWIKVAAASDCGTDHDDCPDWSAGDACPGQDVYELNGVSRRRLQTTAGFQVLNGPLFGTANEGTQPHGRSTQSAPAPPPVKAPFELVAGGSYCDYSADRTYIGSFDQAGNILQNNWPGVQACANACQSTPGCNVFSWPNTRVEYNDPTLKDYDSRPCYFIGVSSSADCGTTFRDTSNKQIDAYALTGTPTSISGSTTGGYTGEDFECSARAMIDAYMLPDTVSDDEYNQAVIAAHAALNANGGSLSSLCCDVQNALVDFAFSAGFVTAQRYSKLWTYVALSDWASAAERLDGSWCRRNAARCASHKQMLAAGMCS